MNSRDDIGTTQLLASKEEMSFQELTTDGAPVESIVSLEIRIRSSEEANVLVLQQVAEPHLGHLPALQAG